MLFIGMVVKKSEKLVLLCEMFKQLINFSLQ